MSEVTDAPVDMLTAHARAQGDKTAVIDDRPGSEPRSMTYAELNAYVNRVVSGLRELGVAPGDTVMWCGQNSLELVAMTHAARKLGVTAVPLNYRLEDHEAAFVVDNSDSTVVWTDVAFAPLFRRIAGETPRVRHVVVFGGPPEEDQIAEADFLGSADEPVIDPEAKPKTMIYTSGTTGKPKGAVREGLGSPEQLAALLGAIGYSPDDVYVTCGPLYHSGPGGFAGIAAALGNTVVVQHKFNAEDWLRLIETYKCTTTFSAPTPIRMVCNLPQEVKDRYDTSSMRVMIANAAPWPYALKEQYVRDFPADSLWEVYGSTEMGVNTLLAPADQLRKPGSCGKPAPGVEVKLVDPEGNEVTEPNVPGELFVRSASMFVSYHKAHDKYQEDEIDGGWHTVGDIAYRDEEGFLFICDRKKDMIISGGMNIYPAEIEAALETSPRIFEVAVFGIPSEEWGESVHAVVVRADDAVTEEDVIAYAREHLAGYKIPRSVSFIDEIPKTGSNKILKRELRAPFWEGHATAIA
ncbi:MAG: AMP-binding protein [Actinomycetota bacterium]|nr:AMP-binding protein [Actinomycetota bacterium]